MATRTDYKYEVILYPDSREYDCNGKIDLLKSISKQWLWINHNQDYTENGEPIKSHIHFYGIFEKSWTLRAFSEDIGVKPENIEYIKKWKSIPAYAIHLFSDDKHRYEIKEVHANFDFKQYLQLTEDQAAEMVWRFIQETCPTKRDLLNYAFNSHVWSTIRRGWPIWKEFTRDNYF